MISSPGALPGKSLDLGVMNNQVFIGNLIGITYEGMRIYLMNIPKICGIDRSSYRRHQQVVKGGLCRLLQPQTRIFGIKDRQFKLVLDILNDRIMFEFIRSFKRGRRQ